MTRAEKIFALKNSKPFNILDIFIFGFAIMLIIITVCVAISRPEGNFVSVSIQGETIGYYSLDDSGKYEIAEGRLILVIKDGMAYVTDSKCPDHYCEKMGRIKRIGQQIVCLPSEIVITVTEDTRGGIGNIVTG